MRHDDFILITDQISKAFPKESSVNMRNSIIFYKYRSLYFSLSKYTTTITRQGKLSTTYKTIIARLRRNGVKSGVYTKLYF